MDDALKNVESHFSAGRIDEAIRGLAGTSLQGLVEVKIVEDFAQWSRTNAETTIGFEAMKASSIDIYHAEAGAVVQRPLEFDDREPAVFLIRNASIAAGRGLISTEDGRLLRAASNWGKRIKEGDFAKEAYGVIAARNTSNELLCRRFSERRVVPEAIYVSLGSKTFGITLMSLAGIALISHAIGNNNSPLICQRKARPRSFESDMLRKLGFEDNEIIVADDAPTTRVERLWVPYLPMTLFPKHIVSCSAAFSAFRQRLGVRNNIAGGDRIYISRRDATRRLIEREDELIEILQGYGFRTLEFTDLGVDARIEALKNAGVIFGPLGSNMYNALFAPAGCWVVEMVPNFYDVDPAVRDAIANFSCSIGHNYVRIPCDVLKTEEKYSHWNIEIRKEELRTGLDFVMSSLPPIRLPAVEAGGAVSREAAGH